MSSKRKIIKRMLVVSLILTICFIWGHSAVPRRISASESGGIVELFLPLWKALSVSYDMADHIVRKCAHFIEYSALGAQWCALLSVCGRRRAVVLSANISLYVALVDETIQIFSARGPQIQDVWLDLGGSLFGALVIFVVMKKTYFFGTISEP